MTAPADEMHSGTKIPAEHILRRLVEEGDVGGAHHVLGRQGPRERFVQNAAGGAWDEDVVVGDNAGHGRRPVHGGHFLLVSVVHVHLAAPCSSSRIRATGARPCRSRGQRRRLLHVQAEAQDAPYDAVRRGEVGVDRGVGQAGKHVGHCPLKQILHVSPPWC